jgi:16S rRNA (guanine527-N7)-methyltransferase
MPALCDFDFSGKRIADLGTGGGLPGIPLKIVTPSAKVTLIDSIQKKIAACSAMIAELGLSEIEAIRGRAEELAQERITKDAPKFRRAFDAVISRATAPLADLCAWTNDLLKPNALIIALKGGDLNEELAEARKKKFVHSIEVKPLELTGYAGFVSEEKKIVTVRLI